MIKPKPSAFLREIDQQPAALRALIACYQKKDGRRRLTYWAQKARAARRVLFAGMGTSEFTPEAILTSLGEHRVEATTTDAGERVHYPRPLPPLVVLISQSGESIETRTMAERLPSGQEMMAIVNNPRSTLARLDRKHLPMCAGHETAISTKTYVNTLAVLFLMARALEGQKAVDQGLRQLATLADAMPRCDTAEIVCAARLLGDAKAIHFIGRGPAMAAVKQAALTFAEGTRISTTAYTGGSFRHGPFELAGKDHRAVFFIPEGQTRSLLASMAQEVAEKGSRVVVITDDNIRLPGKTACILKTPKFGEELFPLAAATTQELLLDAVARKRGMQAGHFRFGGKITAKE